MLGDSPLDKRVFVDVDLLHRGTGKIYTEYYLHNNLLTEIGRLLVYLPTSMLT